MAAIIFFRTKDLETISRFYTEHCGMELWLDQGGCRIFRSENQLIGFCQRDQADTEGIITFFFPQRTDVDRMYLQHRSISLSPPQENPKFKIYHFYAQDPEGRNLEFQSFDHPLPKH